jgi:hypothetical protein
LAAYSTPIVLDLNGDGVHTLAMAAGVQFDLLANGSKVQTGWVGSGDGLLALDRNHDGSIGDGSELFGSSTLLANGQRASDGYAALGELDANHDGVISSADAAFGDLRVWVDGNADGVSAAGELRTLADLGITEISVNATAGDSVDNGNILGLTSSFRTADGSSHAAADVWFQIQPGNAQGNSMGDKVSTLAQAIGVFDAAPDAVANPVAAALTQPGSAAAVGTASLAVQDMVAAMRRFDSTTQSAVAADNGGTGNTPLPAMLASPGTQSASDALEQSRRLAQLSAPLTVLPK